MKLQLWLPGTPSHKKWQISLLLLVLLCALLPIFSRSFVPTSAWSDAAWVLAVLCIVIQGGLLWHWFRRGLWTPGEPWSHYSHLKRWLMAPLYIAFFVWILWLDLAVAAPMLVTRLVGEEVTRSTWVQKKRGSGRRSCRHQLQLSDTHFWLFEFCIDRDDFKQLPEGPLQASVSSLRSHFGEYIHTVELRVPSEPPTAAVTPP